MDRLSFDHKAIPRRKGIYLEAKKEVHLHKMLHYMGPKRILIAESQDNEELQEEEELEAQLEQESDGLGA